MLLAVECVSGIRSVEGDQVVVVGVDVIDAELGERAKIQSGAVKDSYGQFNGSLHAQSRTCPTSLPGWCACRAIVMSSRVGRVAIGVEPSGRILLGANHLKALAIRCSHERRTAAGQVLVGELDPTRQ